MNEGRAYADRWVAAWNSGVLDRALDLWADDLQFESPLAAEITGSPVIHGKAAVAAYWRAALDQASHLHFELEQVLWDADERTVAIIYRRERGSDVRLAAEVIKLNDAGLGTRGIALHGAALSR